MDEPRYSVDDRSQPAIIMRGLSAETYFTLAPSGQPQNLVEGLLYACPFPTEKHEDAVLNIARAVDGCARRRGGKTFVNPDCWLGESTVVQPDVAYLAPERVRVAGRFLREAPDLVIEVTSSGAGRFDREVKFSAYPGTAVREAWLVDLDARTVTVFAASGDGWETLPVVAFGGPLPSLLLPEVGAAGLAAGSS